MPMTVIVTRDVKPRIRGFLSSVALEIAPGVYTSPRMTTSIRKKIWDVLIDWRQALGSGSIVMTWRDSHAPGGQNILTLGLPPKEIVDIDGVLLVRKKRI